MTAAKTPAKRTPAKRPATAKAPQDHKPAAPKVKREELPDNEGFRLTFKGVTIDVTPDLLNDYEFVKAMKNNDIAETLPKFAGDKEDAVVEACRGENGITRMYGPGSVDEFIGTMLEALSPND